MWALATTLPPDTTAVATTTTSTLPGPSALTVDGMMGVQLGVWLLVGLAVAAVLLMVVRR